MAALGEDLPGQPGPEGGGKTGGIDLPAFQIQPPGPGRLLRRNRNGLCRCRETAVHRGGEKAQPGPGFHKSLGLQLLIGRLHRDDGHPQVLRQGPLGGQPLPGGENPAENVVPQAAVQIFIQRQTVSIFQMIGQHGRVAPDLIKFIIFGYFNHITNAL